jgi:hypothetical protein
METSSPGETPSPKPFEPGVSKVLIAAGILTILGDFLFWPATPGLSIALFALACCIALLMSRPPAGLTRAAAILCLLLSLTAFQTSIELSFSNLLVLLLLLTAVVGETSFPLLRATWTRWAEGTLAMVRAPKAWSWVLPKLRGITVKPKHAQQYASVFGQVAVPTAILVFLFAVLLSWGNAVFAKGISDAFLNAWELVPSLSFGRAVLWILLATFALGLLRPVLPLYGDRLNAQTIPTLPPPSDLRIANWRGISILAALNVLFFAVNTIDAVYLWVHGKLPAGVSYSEFVHQGVYSLTAAVLLSAVVLVAVYQQAPAVTASKSLRLLALVWIGQNVVLIASVLLRLKLYVEAYQLSELRIYVACFLLLVTVGFGLLAWRIVKSKNLGWLLLTNLLATFALFFCIQFPDVARWVADYNVARWQQDASRTLDVAYLATLGHSAYSALSTVAETPGRSEAHEAFVFFQSKKEYERERLATLNWRSWQTRPVRNARFLVEHEIRTKR